eukprot:gnl/Spiro4/7359_TR3854_c0_g1_i1.p1 gnl/Spiro4/7359_TR3854_c0_g1~~gnl/Spiro4/7359_TR3854_c0_g1_i1.p1  ORF type:complete len:648 (-),score=-116.84 gnl/Spiro4/7359_TR3854_c0_g1_i1:973-2916(-)
MGISTAVPANDVSRTSGYQLNKGNFSTGSPYLPHQVVILAEANTANQGTIVTTPVQITSAAQAGQTYGYGSPIHAIARQLFPKIGGIPVWVMAQLADAGSTGTVNVWTITGSATTNYTHYINIAGREILDYAPYSASIAIGDTGDIIATKYFNAINSVLGSPVIATKSIVAGTNGSSSVAFSGTSLTYGQTVTLAGLTYTCLISTTSLASFSATSLTAGQTVTLGGLTYTSTGTTTQAQLAAAFASLANGATTGAGTGTGTYSGSLTGFNTGSVSSNTVVFTSVSTGPAPAGYPVVQTGTGPAATITNTAGTYPSGTLTLTTKWTGATSASLTTAIDVNGNAAGITYALTSTTSGAGTPSIANALTQFQSSWYTLVINSYGVPQLSALESFNGIPDPVNPTGQYLPQVFMPFMAFFGSTDPVAGDLVTITDASARIPNVTNILCPAPASGVMPYEAGAAMCLLFANIAQSTPHLTVAGESYVDIPVPPSNLIGDLANYTNRNLLKSKGCSTVMLVNGAYQVQDLVTTYHPSGEVPLVFNEARYLNIDWNVYYGYNLLQIAHLNDKTIVADGQITTVPSVIRPSDWKAILFTYFDTLAALALITNPAFSKASLNVQIDPNNPNRFNTTFSYKRTGTAEIESTTVTVGF